MILRPYQTRVVKRALEALRERGNTLVVAPTGAGKTVMLSAILGQHGGRALVVQHREELVDQNSRTYCKVNPGAGCGYFTASEKRWASDGATFGMVQTLARNLGKDWPAFDLVVIDEAHHAAARTYRETVAKVIEANPKARLLGVTATPNRGDGKGLRDVFDNVADQITLGELLAGGYLVPPRAHVIDVGISSALGKVQKTRLGEYDMGAVAALVDTEPVADAMIKAWLDKARLNNGDVRRTIAFCPTVDHAEHLAAAFNAAGHPAACVHGGTPADERARVFRDIATGPLRVLANVAVATEGFDAPPISCVLLCRPSSFHSTLIQMIGRGLRTIDPARFPGVVKTDCQVLDFGRSLLTWGTLNQLVDLDGREPDPDASPEPKTCPECGCEVPLGQRTCPLCGYEWPREMREAKTLDELRMVEIELIMRDSPFLWWVWNERTRVVTAFDAAAVVCEVGGLWYAVGKVGRRWSLLAMGTESQCIARADDHMREHGDAKGAGRNRRWLVEPPSDKQLAHLARLSQCPPIPHKYAAACALELAWGKRAIVPIIHAAQAPLAEAA